MDGVSAETGQLSGFTTWVKEVDSECEAMHWVIHRETLARQKMSLELNILQNVMKIINYIEIRAFNSCLLMQLYEEIDTEHAHLFLYTKVRWLSKSRSLARVFLKSWMIITLQRCVRFCCTTTWINCEHTCIPSLGSLPPTAPPPL